MSEAKRGMARILRKNLSDKLKSFEVAEVARTFLTNHFTYGLWGWQGWAASSRLVTLYIWDSNHYTLR